MIDVLVIGLDKPSRNIISSLKLAKCNVMGFDFDIDKISLFHKQGLLVNSSSTLLNDLLKESNIIILNIDSSKYDNIFKLVPFIKNDCLIINTNICKTNINDIKNKLQNRTDNFVPCNFLLFPNLIIMNYDIESKMNFILKASNFFKNLKIKTAVLSPSENDKIFSELYQIPYLIQKTLFKNHIFSFIKNDNNFTSSSYFSEDILLNKKNIINDLTNFLDNLPNSKDINFVVEIFKINHFNYIKTPNIIETELNDELIIKILIEKAFIKTFISGEFNYYMNLEYLNFDYIKYNYEEVIKYYIENKETIRILLIILKEKIINLSSFIQSEDLSVNKFIKFINNL